VGSRASLDVLENRKGSLAPYRLQDVTKPNNSRELQFVLPLKVQKKLIYLKKKKMKILSWNYVDTMCKSNK
jgi:hypothetical protein